MSMKRLLTLLGSIGLLLFFVVTPIVFARVYDEEFGFRRTMLHHFGRPNGRLVPDVNVALTSDDLHLLNAASYRLAEMGAQGVAALPAIETYFWNDNLDPDASWLLTYALTKMDSNAIEVLGLASVHPTNSGQGLASRFFHKAPTEQQIEVLQRLSAKGQVNNDDQRILKAIDTRLADLSTEQQGESEGEDSAPNSLDPMEMEEAIAVLNDVWRKDAPYPRTDQMQQQLKRAENAIRTAGDAGAIRVAEWLLSDNSPDDYEVAHLFGSLGSHREAAIPTLIQGMEDLKNKLAAGKAIRELDAIGPPAQAAVPALLRATKYRDPEELSGTIQLQAKAALKWIDPDAYVDSQRSYADLGVLLGFALAYLAFLGWFARRYYRKRKPSVSTNA